MLECILKDTDNKHIIIALLECLLNSKIKEFEYIGIQRFDGIIEYDFSLVKIKILFDDNKKQMAYLRMIKGGKIKESIFCYWSLIYEQYLTSTKKIEIPKKVVITEKTIENNKKSLILNINKDFNYSTEITLVELKKFIIENSSKNTDLKKLLDYLNNYDKDILFLGMI